VALTVVEKVARCSRQSWLLLPLLLLHLLLLLLPLFVQKVLLLLVPQLLLLLR
jgi:hypothetical protein